MWQKINSFGEIFLSFIFFFFAFEKSNYSFPSLIISLQLSRSSSYSLVILYICRPHPSLLFLPWSERGNRLEHDFYQVSKMRLRRHEVDPLSFKRSPLLQAIPSPSSPSAPLVKVNLTYMKNKV